ncbi:MAG: squalene/phytoene synthase family protein [Pseudomonadota bacterium]
MTNSVAVPSLDHDHREAVKHTIKTVKQSRTSFGPGMAILPKPRREAMHAVYAFCREVDDIADDDGLSRDERLSRLADWRQEIDRLYPNGTDASPRTSTGKALLVPIKMFELPKEEFLLMIDGMEIDARGPVVAPSMEELMAYTRRVAGAVGLLSMPIFGAPKIDVADTFALALGDALQLTNILRDVGDDARIGRLYLPRELLERHGAPTTPEMITSSAALAHVAEELGDIAAQKFADARSALREFDWRSVRPALLMMGVYETYLARLRKRGWDKTGESLSLSGVEKATIATRWLLAPRLHSGASG